MNIDDYTIHRQTSKTMTRSSAIAFCIGVSIWVGGFGAAISLISRYDYETVTTAALPATTRVARTMTTRLALFVHPRCPCSRASLIETAKIVSESPSEVKVEIYFFRPANESDAWVQTDLWKLAEKWSGAALKIDVDGQLARSLGVISSGHVLLYDATGNLVFSGGTTASRGHEGINFAALALGQCINSRSSDATTPVFGCSLYHTEKLN